jgi:hypothetical protein
MRLGHDPDAAGEHPDDLCSGQTYRRGAAQARYLDKGAGDRVISGVMNRALDGIAQTTVTIAGRRLPAFRLFGVLGFGLGIAAGTGFAAARGLSPWPVIGLGAVAAATFLAVAAVVGDENGRERLVYYHHQLAVLTTTTALLVIVHADLRAYLDCVAVGLGIFLFCGRIGCLMVGCCHGRPAPIGIRYRAEHVRAGLSAHRAGVRLLPVQALESMWTLVSVGAAVAASSSYGAGAGMATYVLAYALGRFFLEFGRGDGARAYLWGLSEAQWTSVALSAAVIAAEAANLVPKIGVELLAGALLPCAATATVLLTAARNDPEGVLLTPRHLDEVTSTAAHLLARAAADTDPLNDGPVAPFVHIAETSQGLSISASTASRPDRAEHRFGLSRPAGLSVGTARALADLLGRLLGEVSPPAVLTRGNDVFHLTVVHRYGGASSQGGSSGSAPVSHR